MKFDWRTRDWLWLLSYFIVVIVLLLTYKVWGKSEDLVTLISLGVGFISVVLALVAIGQAIVENIRSYFRENKVETALDKIILNVDKMDKILGKIDGDNSSIRETQHKIFDAIDKYKAYYSEEDTEEPTTATFGNVPQASQKSLTPEEDKNDLEKTKLNKVKDEMDLNVERGQIYLADLPKFEEKNFLTKPRPVLVMQNEFANHYSSSVTVIPITSSRSETLLPSQFEFILEGKYVIGLGEQLSMISKSRLKRLITTVDDEVMISASKAVAFHMGE
jgi:mRNA-degrading endonuclease toxin of MazEF toxin-antitoxin module